MFSISRRISGCSDGFEVSLSVTEPEEKIEKVASLIKKEVTSAKLFKCKFEECDRVFNDQSNYKKHMATHGEKQV